MITTYKGFNKDMTCKNFQYKEGEEYETDRAEACKEGFHACEYPLDCFSYYPPNDSIYRKVEQDGKISKHDSDSKVASTKIKIGVQLGIADMVKAAIEFTMSKIKSEAKADEDYGASSATGDYGASSATGYKGASSATGNYGASLATGNYGASSATGYKGASSATGDYGASSATGDYGASSATGYKGASSATGYCGASSATGYKCSAEAKDPCAIAVAWGYKGRAKGVKGSRIVLADWEGDENNYWTEEKWTLKGAKMVKIDGKKYKENTWYTMKDGKIVEWEGE